MWKTTVRFGIGLVTIIPLVYVVGFFVMGIRGVIIAWDGGSEWLPVAFEFAFGLHLAMMALMFALTIGYLIHVHTNGQLSDHSKTNWMIFVVVTQSIGMLVYLWKHVLTGENHDRFQGDDRSKE